jgi:Bifunctional DNA primase/polymerase, N-terminal
MQIYTAEALRYLDMGLSVVPVGDQKRAKGEWEIYQHQRMTPLEAEYHFSRRDVCGIAIIGGAISGGFEGLDFDAKYDLTGSMFDTYWDRLHREQDSLAAQLVMASTRNKGRHLYYRSPDVGRHLELARRKATPEELKVLPNRKFRTLIETRSNGQYIIVPPSPGYTFLQRDLSKLTEISPKERKIVLDIARSHNKYFDIPASFSRMPRIDFKRESPLDDFDQRENGEVVALLKKHGWVVVDDKNPSKTIFRRPGDTKQWSSGDYDHTIKRFTVLTDRTVFTKEWGYRPSAVFTYLECNKDFKEACRRLLALGFGIAYKDQR